MPMSWALVVMQASERVVYVGLRTEVGAMSYFVYDGQRNRSDLEGLPCVPSPLVAEYHFHHLACVSGRSSKAGLVDYQRETWQMEPMLSDLARVEWKTV